MTAPTTPMTPTTRDEFFQALSQNRERPKGRPTAAIAEDLVEAAEAFGDDEVTVSALVELMRAYHGSGEAVKYPVAFARLLRLWDANPKAFSEDEVHRLFWFFKWVGAGLLTTPDVPLASIRGWIAEMRRRYQAAGHELQPVYGQEFFLARQLGDGEELAYELWATRGRTRFSDCAACEARSRASYHFRCGEDERGLTELQPTFDGEHSCDEEPHTSQALALLPLLRLGRLDEARATHLTGYRKVRGNEAELTPIGQHLEFCALTGNEARGLELLAQNRASFGFSAAPSSRLDFLTGVEVLLARLDETGHGELPCAGPLGTEWTVASLRAAVAAQADELAARFDARNGNDAVSARRRERLAARPQTASLNLGVQTSVLPGAAAEPTVSQTGAATEPASSPTTEVPEDFAELVAAARDRDRIGGPAARALWDAVLERVARADGAADAADARDMDELLPGEVASELAQRAADAQDWDGCAVRLREAIDHYRRIGRTARVIASEARLVWSGAVRSDVVDGVAAAETAMPQLDELLAGIDALAAAGTGSEEEEGETLDRRLVVRQSRVLTARHALFRAQGPEQHARWAELFAAEAEAVIAEGTTAGRLRQVAMTHELLAEFQAMHGEAVEGEASARRAIGIFTEQGWPWRLPRARLLLALAFGAQERYPEAMAELERGLAEAPSDVAANELTPLHRMLGSMALRAKQHATAVRAFSEAAARLDREGEALQARETRWELSRVLRVQGSTGDAAAVLESLLDASSADAAHGADQDGAAEPSEPSAAEQLTAQIRVDLANCLLVLEEPRDAAREFLLLADMVSRWPEKGPLTSAAAAAAAALAQAGNWEGARAALGRALTSNAEAPNLPELSDALRTLAYELVEARGKEAKEEALGYLDRADRLREEFPEAAREQFRSVEVDAAQCWYTRGQVHGTVGEGEAALAAFEQAVAVYDRSGHAAAAPRFEAIRLAAVVESRALDRSGAARERLDKAVAEAEAAGLPQAAQTLRQLRDSLR